MIDIAGSLHALGITAADITLIHEKHGHSLYRINNGDRHFAAKWFPNPSAGEPQAYACLQSLGVPTLPVYSITQNLIIMEDLDYSRVWRKAEKEDMSIPEVGCAIAQWYKVFHKAGESYDKTAYAFRRETDLLNAAVIMDIGKYLGMELNPVWRTCAESIELIKDRMSHMPETLNYNDFHWSNVAISRDDFRVVVYDYHLLGRGLRYSDCRNVTYSLDKRAKEAFWSVYGETDEEERILDAPTSILYSLIVAVKQPQIPKWAHPLIKAVEDGELERMINNAISIL